MSDKSPEQLKDELINVLVQRLRYAHERFVCFGLEEVARKFASLGEDGDDGGGIARAAQADLEWLESVRGFLGSDIGSRLGRTRECVEGRVPDESGPGVDGNDGDDTSSTQ